MTNPLSIVRQQTSKGKLSKPKIYEFIDTLDDNDDTDNNIVDDNDTDDADNPVIWWHISW